jgi:hypothetical protein
MINLKMDRFENLKIGHRLQGINFKHMGNTKQLEACSLKLVAPNQEIKNNFQSITVN